MGGKDNDKCVKGLLTYASPHQQIWKVPEAVVTHRPHALKAKVAVVAHQPLVPRICRTHTQIVITIKRPFGSHLKLIGLMAASPCVPHCRSLKIPHQKGCFARLQTDHFGSTWRLPKVRHYRHCLDRDGMHHCWTVRLLSSVAR